MRNGMLTNVSVHGYTDCRDIWLTETLGDVELVAMGRNPLSD